MSGEVNYKLKYQQLKAKFMESVDMAFKLGYEQGAKEAQMDQMAQQQQAQMEQEAMMQQNAMGGGMPPGAEASAEPSDANAQAQMEPMQESEHPGGSELDQHIAQLESMLGKSEVTDANLKTAIEGLKAIQAKKTLQSELKKSAQAIPAIAKALHKPAFKIGKLASHNLDSNAKAAVTMQHKIVTNIMEKWETESSKAAKEIKNVLNIEGLTKSEE